MAAKKTDVIDIRKIALTNTAVLGTDKTLRALKKGLLMKVFVASNCAPATKDTLKQYCNLEKIPYEELREDDTEIGVICKKQFSIAVVGVLKNK